MPDVSLRMMLAVVAAVLWLTPQGRLVAQESAAVSRAQATVVLYNTAFADSATLAKFYARERGVPLRQVIGLEMPEAEAVDRGEYEDKIAKPLLAKLEALNLVEYRENSVSRKRVLQGLKFRFLVPIRGVPVKVTRLPKPVVPEGQAPPPKKTPFDDMDEASVDSELVCLLVTLPQLEGPAQNPYYKSFTPIIQATNLPPMLLVSRLDAPNERTVFRMIRDSLETEKAGRLWGRAWVDSRGISQGGYATGDEWLRNARKTLDEAFIPVIWDERDAMFPPGSPVGDCAIYLGWYGWNASSPWTDEGFRFHRGAVVAHIHSFSAEILRTPNQRWVGPLLEHGAAATVGNVAEPFLHLTTNLDVLTERLLEGFTFGEAFYMAQPALSWMAVAVGDPLYRPFPKQEDLLAADPTPPAEDRVYAQIHSLLKLWATEDPRTATKEWTTAAEESRGKDAAILWEALAFQQARVEEYRPALISAATARSLYKDAGDRMRCLILESQCLVRTERNAQAIDLLERALADPTNKAQAPALTFYLHELAPPPPTPPAGP